MVIIISAILMVIGMVKDNSAVIISSGLFAIAGAIESCVYKGGNS